MAMEGIALLVNSECDFTDVFNIGKEIASGAFGLVSTV